MIIGIGGASRSGKTTLARMIVNYFRDNGHTAINLYQDDFVFPTTKIPMVRDKIDWERPESINFDLLKEVVDFYKTKFEVLVVDGFLAFYDEDLNNRYDQRIFVSISKETYLKRKEEDLRWGPIPRWFFDHIWESYLSYGIPDFEAADYIQLSGEDEYDINEVLKALGIDSDKKILNPKYNSEK